tara:strand:- start:613 stop:1323 length:711 start_codon:yes stop_codon:yes gene_type:complete
MRIDKIMVIGAGGVGSWLIPALQKLRPDDYIEVWDGDILEEKNMDRQLFDDEHIDMNKAWAMKEKYGGYVGARDRYYTHGADSEITDKTFIFGCADNHPARKEILTTADRTDCKVIIGGNSYTDADGYFYENVWRDTPCDPRVYYPDILTDTSGSPVHAAGCTGEAQRETPQLVLANYWAAAHMLHLFWYHTEIAPNLDRSSELYEQMRQNMPMLERNSAYKFETLTVNDLNKQHA